MTDKYEDILARLDGQTWKQTLLLGRTGTPKPLLANAIIALGAASEWLGVLAFNEFSSLVEVRAEAPWDAKCEKWETRWWNDTDDIRTAEWLQQQGIAVSVNVASQAVQAVADSCRYHPVREYLDGLKHDGVSRVGAWLTTYLGAALTPYHREVGRSMMIAAVARIYRPGCKVDTMPILEGSQGAKKSTALKAIFDPWFSDEISEFGTKDASMQMRGVWGIEAGELEAMGKGDVARIKAFITRTTDRFRPPYGRRVVEVPRSCVLLGSTNADGYLKDETGGRRFLPVKIGKIDIEALRRDRDQLWAEAVSAYRAGDQWWMTDRALVADAELQQRARYAGDPWDGIIAAYAEGRKHVSVEEILQDVLHLERGRWGRREEMRISASLRSQGWDRKQIRVGDARAWKYVRSVTENDENGEQSSNVTNLRAT